MKNLPIEDVLSWERFFNESKKRNFYPPKEIEMFNRLVLHTNNFFVIAAIGAFTPGYLMLVTKKLLPSFSLIDDEQLNELKWLIKVTSNAIKETYNREVVSFETKKPQEGKRVLEVNGEKNTIKLEGYIRDRDITTDNTIYSYNIANAKIEYSKGGIVENVINPRKIQKWLTWGVGLGLVGLAFIGPIAL